MSKVLVVVDCGRVGSRAPWLKLDGTMEPRLLLLLSVEVVDLGMEILKLDVDVHEDGVSTT